MAVLNPQISALSAPLTVDGNRLTLLADGLERLDALVKLIDSARTSLRILYYIFKDDAAGRRVRDALLAACARGVKVDILIDGFGSDDVGDAFFRPLIESECGFCRFTPRWGRRYLLRNHQKLALADGKTVLIGGFNVSDDYFDKTDNSWRDLGLQVEGPSVRSLEDYFDALFAWARRRGARMRELRAVLNRHSQRDGILRWQFGGPTRRLSPWARTLKRDMLRATRLDMIAAYFAPSRGMLRRIYGIARRGAARIVTASKSDNRATIGAARHTYWRLLRHGVEVYEYQPTKLHTKLIVVDDVVHIGSANFDMRSLYLNLELMLRVESAEFAARMRAYADGEIADSRPITRAEHRARRSWWNRFVWSVAYFLVATMDYNLSRRLNFGLEGR
ncbi:phosphatidylserine/phosphatidylglycerophosphate/cardiolipin synthase family protein [Allosphingosinicella flava]|uniref:Phospholipase D n=1 Tax=Allosphingosinicella flava TaxID=2771430 RepID=A0A7T2LLP0_9SPHN|nr:phosphatidylserine/phosphatidylglycerophosphate/cardiolipin synthase family protein [Sphingosinicella flava]QPQ54701.1 phosphatidylserine/phosphatidylglycerophosphate/cardiolipin synthase family protein [Sphingosinicella flava]